MVNILTIIIEDNIKYDYCYSYEDKISFDFFEGTCPTFSHQRKAGHLIAKS